MKTNYIKQDGLCDGIDFDAHYKVKHWPGIAVVLLGWKATYEPLIFLSEDEEGNEIESESGEFDEVADTSTVIAVMVGDDRRHEVDRDDLVLIPEDGFCRSCGQIGCGCNVYA